MAIYETHCHLNHRQFDGDSEEAIERAVESDVKRLLVVSYDLTSSRRAMSLARSHEQLVAAVGVHPEDGAEWSEAARDELVSLCQNNPDKVVAWGEIGLDYHWKTLEPTVQKTIFTQQLSAAKSVNLPVIIHCRDAYDDTLDILDESSPWRGVVHCFTGTVEQAARTVALGYHIGIGGVITYKSAANLREVAAAVPIDRLLIETDSPFLAPVPWRGKRNEPAYLTAIVEKLAEVLHRSPAEIRDITWQNAIRLFGR